MIPGTWASPQRNCRPCGLWPERAAMRSTMVMATLTPFGAGAAVIRPGTSGL